MVEDVTAQEEDEEDVAEANKEMRTASGQKVSG